MASPAVLVDRPVDSASKDAAGPGPGSSGGRIKPKHIHDDNPYRVYKLLFAGGEFRFLERCMRSKLRDLTLGRPLHESGLAGAISRTATAPIDRLKMLLQVQEERMSIREGLQKMASEGVGLMSMHGRLVAGGTIAVARGSNKPCHILLPLHQAPSRPTSVVTEPTCSRSHPRRP